MSKTALFVRRRAKPGQRAQVERIWREHAEPRVESNPNHEAYFSCLDAKDPDVICVFQLFRDAQSVQDFLAGEWYPKYLA